MQDLKYQNSDGQDIKGQSPFISASADRAGNPEQQEAIRHGAGPMMVLAGPGSGKTFVLTRRIAHLINTHHINPSEILVITFTRAAAGEMQQRFLSLCEGSHPPVTFGTFHAIFYSILKETSICHAGSILSEAEKRKILRDIIQKNHYNVSLNTDMLEEILSEIGQYKSLCFSRGDTNKERSVCESNLCFSRGDAYRFNKNENIDFIPQNIDSKLFRNIYRDFTEAQEILGKVDFDDMALKCAELFAKRPDILRRYQTRYRYLLIDEFQDIAPLQYTLVRMLAAPRNNLFIVGDDDQSIYGFRGARPDIMRNFPGDYPEAKIVSLQVNYRSTPEVVQAAGRLIACNQNRFPKDGRAENAPGSPIRVQGYETEGMMESALIRYLMQEKKTGTLQACAVISRTSGCFPLLSEKFRQSGIPCSFREKVKSIFDHDMVNDLTAYLEFSRTSVRNRTRSQFFRFMNRPLRYISREAVNETADFRYLINCYKGRPAMQETILRLQQDLERIRTMPVFPAINYIRKAMGYDSYLLEKYGGKSSVNGRAEAGNILELADLIQDSARGCKTFQAWKEEIDIRREGNAPGKVQMSCRNAGAADKMRISSGDADAGIQISAGNAGIANKIQLSAKAEAASAEKQLSAGGGKEGQKPEPGVTLMTMHGSKGLEYDKVFIINCNEGSTPHRKARSEEEIEEERRMFYVGMTRAKKELTLLYVTGEKGTKKESGAGVMPPSRFLKEIRETL